MMASKRRSEGGKMKRMPDYDFVVSACWDQDGDERPGKCVRKGYNMGGDFHTPREPARGIGRLISGLAGTPDDVAIGCMSKSAIDDVGVEVRKEAIYLVSAISRWSRISSRSSIRKAKCSVSLEEKKW
jgi:hypothetical protein